MKEVKTPSLAPVSAPAQILAGILDSAAVAHRPWGVPPGGWVMSQVWHDLLFAHWPLPAHLLRPLLPAGLELEQFEGQAWLGIVPFRMSNIRPRGVPPFAPLSNFAELNVRTYVTRGGKPGVFFFSLDAANPVAVATARRWFHLPYFNARMKCQPDGLNLIYSSRRTHRQAPEARFEGAYGPVGPPYLARPGTLEHWLTERYCLYSVDRRGRLYRGEIHHRPWPLQPAQATITLNTMAACHALRLPDSAPLLHFARRLQVIVWGLQKIGDNEA